MYTYEIETEITGQRNDWIYYFFHLVYGIRTRVWQKFLCHVLNLDKSRLLKVQKNLLNGEPLHDKRGSHRNQKLKSTEEVKQLIHTHCASLPHTETHYSSKQTKLHYFENPELTLIRLPYMNHSSISIRLRLVTALLQSSKILILNILIITWILRSTFPEPMFVIFVTRMRIFLKKVKNFWSILRALMIIEK